MENYEMIFIMAGLLLFLLLLIGYFIVKYKLEELERDIKNLDANMRESNEKQYNLISNTKIINDIPINEILWALINKCGYKVDTNQAKFKLEKVKK